MLEGAGLTEFIDFTLSNEDIERPKPDPQVYFAAFERLGVRPDECVVIEDSDVGKAAATASGAVLCSVNDPADVNYYRVMRTIRDADRVNVVIPAAGQGKRFAEVGYQHPKPLIDVEGRPMIDLVLENFRGVGRPIVLLQDRHVEQYCADSLIKSLAPDGEVVGVDGLTEGAACTVLLAEPLIDSHERARARELRPGRRRLDRGVRPGDARPRRRRRHPHVPLEPREVELRAHRPERARDSRSPRRS